MLSSHRNERSVLSACGSIHLIDSSPPGATYLYVGRVLIFSFIPYVPQDAELSKKAAASYDHDAENETQLWIEEVTGVKMDGEFGSCLKDGVLLCKVINAVKPGTIKRINTSKMPFKQMENISIFLRACRKLGVPEYSLFETVDLFEEKDLSIVIRCIHSLGGAVQTSCPDYNGPRLGVAQRAPAIRQWTDEQRKRQAEKAAATPTILSKGSSATMEKSKVVLTGITMGADCGGVSKAPNVIAQANLGSSRTMEKTKVVKTGITMGADYGGVSKDPNAIAQANLGSSRTMEKTKVVKTGITMGADYGGVSKDHNAIAQANLGSSRTMEKTKVVKTGITMGADCGGVSKAPNVIAQANLGSSRTMEKTRVVKTGITMGADCGGPPKAPNAVSKANLGSYGIQERLNDPNKHNVSRRSYICTM